MTTVRAEMTQVLKNPGVYRSALSRAGISHREMAKRLGLNQAQFSLMLAGKRACYLVEAYRMSRELSLTLDDVLHGYGLSRSDFAEALTVRTSEQRVMEAG